MMDEQGLSRIHPSYEYSTTYEYLHLHACTP